MSNNSPIKRYAANQVASHHLRARCLRYTSRLIVANNLPFSTVEEDPNFHNMQRVFSQAGAKAPVNLGRQALAADITYMSMEVTDVLRKIIQGQPVFATTDHWTSRDNWAFESQTLQWISTDFCLTTAALSVHDYKGSTKADLLHASFLTKFRKWGVQFSRHTFIVPSDKAIVCGCTTDTESKMNRFGRYLEEETGTDHNYCTDHALQGTAIKPYSFKFLDCNEQADEANTDGPCKDLLRKCRDLATLFNTSSQKKAALIEAQQQNEAYAGKSPVSVKVDVITRWWSTHDMIDPLIHLRPALEQLARDGKLDPEPTKANAPSRQLTEAEWEVLTSVRLLLEPWKSAQRYLEAGESSYLITCSLPCSGAAKGRSREQP